VTEIEWHFLRRDPRARRRDPVTPELFHDDDLRGVAQALVRESIQNSLDARVSTEAPVIVGIFLSGAEAAVKPATALHYFGSLLPHLRSAYPGTASELDIMVAKPCEFLAIEDFGTTGLTGDIRQTTRPPTGESNDFFYFFRAEGASAKGDGSRGRWGIGKHTYFASSRLQAFIGLTVREDADSPGPLAMGQSISRVHPEPEDPTIEVEPDGWMAINSPTTWLPYESGEVTRRVVEDWRLRRNNQPGLSVVVPYCDSNLSMDDLIRSVLQEYSHPLLAGALEVHIESGSGEVARITAQSLQQIAETHLSGTSELQRHLLLIRRMAQLMSYDSTSYVELPVITGSPEWSPDLLPDPLRDVINSRLNDDGFVVVRIPVAIAQQADPRRTKTSFFDVGLFSQTESARAVFIREGLRVTGVGSKSPAFLGLMPIVIIPPGILGSLLGDAEGPAHLNWDSRRRTFAGRYRHGAAWIDFVRQSPRRLVEYSRGLDRESDLTIGSSWFPDSETGRGPQKRHTITPPPPPPPPPSPKVVLFSKRPGGFSARLNADSDEFAEVRTVRLVMAYDRRSGNPFKRWRPADFILGDLAVECAGGSTDETLTDRHGNQITVNVSDPRALRVDITGFDQHRDVIVRAEYA
jgi:hypothetical protein